MKKLIAFLAFAAAINLFIFGRTFSHVPASSVHEPDASENLFRVMRVIDGDTIEVANGSSVEKIRYIGIDAPETVDPRKPAQCFGREASERNKELVLGKLVRLENDVSDRDKYGRFLRYVYLVDEPGVSVNLELVSEGYAKAFIYPPDIEYVGLFINTERKAREMDLGLWKACRRQI